MTVAERTLAIALAMTATLTVTTASVSGQHNQDRRASPDPSERTIAGVWRTLVTPRSCQTGEQAAPSFAGLFTFHGHGTMSEYGIGPGSSPTLRSPGHGVWQREHGWHDYSFAFTFYRYNPSGVFIGSQTVSAALQLERGGDEFTTKSGLEILDANGAVLATACATAVGRRFE